MKRSRLFDKYATRCITCDFIKAWRDFGVSLNNPWHRRTHLGSLNFVRVCSRVWTFVANRLFMAHWRCTSCWWQNISTNVECSNVKCQLKSSFSGISMLSKIEVQSKCKQYDDMLCALDAKCAKMKEVSLNVGADEADINRRHVELELATPERCNARSKARSKAKMIVKPMCMKHAHARFPTSAIRKNLQFSGEASQTSPSTSTSTLEKFAEFAGVTCADAKDVMLCMALAEDNFFLG